MFSQACPQGGGHASRRGHAWQGVRMAGVSVAWGMHGKGRGVCVVGGMHGKGRGACMAGEHVQQER